MSSAFGARSFESRRSFDHVIVAPLASPLRVVRRWRRTRAQKKTRTKNGAGWIRFSARRMQSHPPSALAYGTICGTIAVAL
jgi:hypothetical protein